MLPVLHQACTLATGALRSSWTMRVKPSGRTHFCAVLDFTTKQQKKAKGTTVRHVSGPELLHGVRQYALKEFGPMVITVFDNWGIHSCEDIGHMVFNLIGAGIFGKTEEDSIEDFKLVYDFQEAFVKPFAPEKITETPKSLPAPKPLITD